MLKFIRDQYKGFLVGACTVAVVASVGTAFADGKLTSINVFQGGIKLFVDGKLTIPTDGNGKVVEPFIYDGTTYLPLRALSNALTNNLKPVSWVSNTSSIYVGQAPVAAQTDITELKPYTNSNMKILKEVDAKFKILDKTITPFNHLTSNGGYGNLVYMMNSNYSEINGQFIIPHLGLGDKGNSIIQFVNVNKKGEESLIKEISTSIGDDSVKVNVDLRGVEILKIIIPDSLGSFYNVTLAGIQ